MNKIFFVTILMIIAKYQSIYAMNVNNEPSQNSGYTLTTSAPNTNDPKPRKSKAKNPVTTSGIATLEE